MEKHQLKDKNPFSGEAELGKFWVIDYAKRQVVANRYLSALGHSISILSYCQLEEGSGDHLASIVDALVSN